MKSIKLLAVTVIAISSIAGSASARVGGLCQLGDGPVLTITNHNGVEACGGVDIKSNGQPVLVPSQAKLTIAN